ncbi:MAG TPA: glycoside hydrolase family 28 protein [Candidatus Acidoferrales bacterium]|nr:glycoside hydrolase family 28 protein [Candidatus Acidoferrales bacterium]
MKILLRAVPFAVVFTLLLSQVLSARADDENGSYFNVRKFGATGDGTTLDSPAIDKAIDACAQAGGGTVYFPAGTYLSGSIHLQSNIHLLIDTGAVILGAPQDMKVYDETEPWTNNPYQDGGHCYFHNSLIWGVGLTNVFITGQGMINGGGLERSDKLLDDMCGFTAWGKNGMMNNGTYPPSRLGNKAIALKLCRNILIRDITIYHGGHFAILVTGCDNMTVDNVTMDTDRDGIDIDCCRNTMVSNCRINSPNDDGLCPKASFALGTNRPTENLTIVNCQVTGYEVGTLLDGTYRPSHVANGRFKCGTESNCGFRNITLSNCTFRDCKGMALEEVDGGIMDNITINNVVMTDVRDYPIYITMGNRNRGPEATTGSIRNIQISNVIATGVDRRSGIEIMGVPGHDIENVRLDNVRIVYKGGGTSNDAARVPKELDKGYPEAGKLGTMPSYGLFARHVRGLELANLTVGFDTNDLRPAMACTDVDGLEIDNFKGQTAAGVKPATFTDVSGLVVRNSPELQ